MLSMKFDNKIDAEIQAESMTDDAALWFCPIIKRICNIDCINFKHPTITEDGGGKFIVSYPNCTNPLITGEMEVLINDNVVIVQGP